MDKLKHLFSPIEAGEYLDLSPKTLANSRSTGTGVDINFLKIGGSIKYRKSDLDKYLDEHTYRHTSQIKAGVWWNIILTIGLLYLVTTTTGF